MNLITFIRTHELETTQEVLKEAPNWATHFDGYLFSEEGFHDGCFLLTDLKHAVEALVLIESYKGIDGAREYLKRWFKLHAGLKKYPKTRTYITDQLDALQKAIQVWESIYAS